ncbi:hypothetical protein K7887_22025 (plasmid) [Sutcliffiella horikoshii]|uniref:hypothetical protein n=1 Tax=Sutcliffiella horikoshii TaxID=79883 RepID=UPI001CBFEB16|nr:hypothetical protein [Sutcliffiella horikoshii]UAL49726.1 hypothetical protein K7887_22025 [Sutcliffiella horikoshii]
MKVNRKNEDNFKPTYVSDKKSEKKAAPKQTIDFMHSLYETDIIRRCYRANQYFNHTGMNKEFLDNRKELKSLELVDGTLTGFRTGITVTPEMFDQLETEAHEAKLSIGEYVRSIIYTSAKTKLEAYRKNKGQKLKQVNLEHEKRRKLPVQVVLPYEMREAIKKKHKVSKDIEIEHLVVEELSEYLQKNYK